MTRSDTILVVLDTDEHAPAVLDEAIDLARQRNAKLLLLRTVERVGAYAPPMLMSMARVTTALEEGARIALRRLARRVPAELIEDAVVQLGNPADVICRVAAERSADLIVIAASRGRFLSRTSSTPIRLVNTAPCPVVVVRNRVAV
jgi:nucleotide-binding universal stress UspA family protein